MEKLIITTARQFSYKKYDTKFFVVRYGNVAASSGSVIPIFINKIRSKKKVTITDPKMTRFNIRMNEAIDFILSSTEIAVGTEVFIPKLKAYNIMDLKNALVELLGDTGYEIINARPGEKLHELLLNKYEIQYTKDLDDRYVLLDPQVFEKKSLVRPEIVKKYTNMKRTKLDKEYSSEYAELLTNEDLKSLLNNYL